MVYERQERISGLQSTSNIKPNTFRRQSTPTRQPDMDKVVSTSRNLHFPSGQQNVFNSGAMGDKPGPARCRRNSRDRERSPDPYKARDKERATGHRRQSSVSRKNDLSRPIPPHTALDERPITAGEGLDPMDNPALGPAILETEANLICCKYCNRRFAEDRIAKHEDICVNVISKRRRKYDATKHRILGTDLESYSMNLSSRSGYKFWYEGAIPFLQSISNSIIEFLTNWSVWLFLPNKGK